MSLKLRQANTQNNALQNKLEALQQRYVKAAWHFITCDRYVVLAS